MLKRQFLHQEIDVLVHLEAVEIVGVALETHQQPSEGDVGRETPRALAGFVTLDPVLVYICIWSNLIFVFATCKSCRA